MSYDKELAFAKELALEAGKIMRRYFLADDIDTQWKEDTTPLTIADTTINAMVIDQVKEHFPEHGVLGEEASFATDREYLWVVDPVDGTIPYSHGIPTSTFSLALTHQGKTMVAVVQDPFTDRNYSAVLGGGAFVNGARVSVNDQKTLDATVFMEVAAKLRFQGFDALKIMQQLVDKHVYVSKNFSAIFHMLPVVVGQHAGGVMLLEHPWDGAALNLLVTEAGGKVTDLFGKERTWNLPGAGMIVSNGYLHEELVKIAAAAYEER